MRLNLLVLLIMAFSISKSHATNPISQQAIEDSEYFSSDDKARTWKNYKIVKSFSRWFHKKKNYFKQKMSKAMKFLFTWLGLSAASILLLVLGYVIILVFPSNVTFILYLVFLLLAVFASIASSVFFILWLIEYVRETERGTKVPGPEEQDELENDSPERERTKRKKRRKRN